MKAPLFEVAIGKGLETGSVKVKVEIEVEIEVAIVAVGPTGGRRSVVIIEELVGGEIIFEPPGDVVAGVSFCETDDEGDFVLDNESWGGEWVVEEVAMELVPSGVDGIGF